MLALWEAGAPLMCQTVTAQKCSWYIFPVTLPGVSGNYRLHCIAQDRALKLVCSGRKHSGCRRSSCKHVNNARALPGDCSCLITSVQIIAWSYFSFRIFFCISTRQWGFPLKACLSSELQSSPGGHSEQAVWHFIIHITYELV